MRHNAFVIKTLTDNERLAKTIVFMPRQDMVVINRRILSTRGDYEDGWFTDCIPIYRYKDRILLENQIVFWTESFYKICEAVKELSIQHKTTNTLQQWQKQEKRKSWSRE